MLCATRYLFLCLHLFTYVRDLRVSVYCMYPSLGNASVSRHVKMSSVLDTVKCVSESMCVHVGDIVNLRETVVSTEGN